MVSISELPVFKNLFTQDLNGREINIYRLTNIQLAGDIYYPNCLIHSNGIVYDPIDERIMSLDIKIEKDTSINKFSKVERCPVFFFIYNTDNYYHFVYDTLPYLISFRKLKSDIKDLKLLMNYPNFQSDKLYKFVIEFLEILDIEKSDIIMCDKETLYSEIFISTSYTHGIDSNLPPRQEIFELYKHIVNTVNYKFSDNGYYPDKIYISRRSWIHKDLSNIGTNYTSKRKLTNENELVDILIQNGFVEVFTETMSTIDKIKMFSKVKTVIGAIGGGLCNVLFSNENTRLISIVSPTFLDVNKRFLYSFSKVKTNLFMETSHLENGYWKRYMRVKTDDGIIGEIEDILDDKLKITYTDRNIAGWNSQLDLNEIVVDVNDCIRLDNGLNSPWTADIEKFKKII